MSRTHDTTVGSTQPHQQDDQGRQERITVALIPRAAEDLRELQEQTGLSKTDLTNRALQLYRYVQDQIAAGNELLVRAGDGQVERIRFF